jgi:hypothetical protein
MPPSASVMTFVKTYPSADFARDAETLARCIGLKVA